MPPEPLREQKDDASLAFFSQYLRQAGHDFPQLEGRLALLDVERGQYVGDIDLQKTGFSSTAELAAYMEQQGAFSKKIRSSCAYSSEQQGDPAHRILILNYIGVLKPGLSEEESRTWTLDHELGHFVVPDGMNANETLSSKNFRECTADVFASLRYLQRHEDPQAVAVVQALAVFRATYFIFGADINHFTSLALEEVCRLRDKIDFKSLTPSQMARLSWRIAIELTPNEHTLANLQKTFDDFRRGLSGEKPLQKLAELLCDKTTSSPVFRAGYNVLKPFLEGQVTLSGEKPDSPREYWDGIRARLKERELRMEAEGMLSGMPLRKITPVNPAPAAQRPGKDCG